MKIKGREKHSDWQGRAEIKREPDGMAGGSQICAAPRAAPMFGGITFTKKSRIYFNPDPYIKIASC